MLLRIALFISLLALFYNFCKKENSTNNFREENELNFIEIREDFSPQINFNSTVEGGKELDSIRNNISSIRSKFLFQTSSFSSTP